MQRKSNTDYLQIWNQHIKEKHFVPLLAIQLQFTDLAFKTIVFLQENCSPEILISFSLVIRGKLVLLSVSNLNKQHLSLIIKEPQVYYGTKSLLLLY